MEVIESGHIYGLRKLDHRDGEPDCVLVFVNRNVSGQQHVHGGTTNQEVLRALISRMKFLESERHWHGNEEIIYHLQRALLLHEIRALERKHEKKQIFPECIAIDEKDLHYKLDWMGNEAW